MNKRFVLGDVHGRYEALVEVLKASKFNHNKDQLILLGDVVDGGEDTFKVVEELLKIKNLVFVKGNHDHWFMEHIRMGFSGEIWLQQGGAATLRSYGAKVVEADYVTEISKIDAKEVVIPVSHQIFFNRAIPYYTDGGDLFVHGGFDPHLPIEAQDESYLTWDREIIGKARNRARMDFKRVFIGHTSTQGISGYPEPVLITTPTTKLWMIDCGAGWNGRLCIMDIDTEKYWLSKIQKPSTRMK